MKKIVFFFFFLYLGANGIAFASPAGSGTITIPQVKKFAKSSQSFVPKKWRLIRKTYGDLNRDKKKDFVGVLEYTNPENREFDFGPPRILIVAFRVTKGYRLVAQANQVVLRSGEGGVFGEPLQSLKILRNTFKITFYGKKLVFFG